MKTITLLFALLYSLLNVPAHAIQRNGLDVEVSKRTQERGSNKRTLYSIVEDTRGLKLSVRNYSIRDFPEGQIQWSILVDRNFHGDRALYKGVEKLPALRNAARIEMSIGSIPVTSYRTDYKNYKDDIEYDIIITHAGKETIRITSKPNFPLLAKEATLMNGEEESGEDHDEEGRRKRKRDIADEDMPNGAGKAPLTPGMAPVAPGAKPTLAPNVTPKVPASPAANGIAVNGTPSPSVPMTAGADPTTAPTELPPVADAPPVKPFDFFNLKKKENAPKPPSGE